MSRSSSSRQLEAGVPGAAGPRLLGLSERFSLGLISVDYTPISRTVVLLGRHLPLLRFRSPELRDRRRARRRSPGRSSAGCLSPGRTRTRAPADHRAPDRGARAGAGSGADPGHRRGLQLLPGLRFGGRLARDRGLDLQRRRRCGSTCWSRAASSARWRRLELPPSRSGALARRHPRARRRRARPSASISATAAAHRLGERRWLDLEERHAGRVLDDRLGCQALDQRSGDAGIDRRHQADPKRS